MSKKFKIFENIIFVAIILVIIQTFLDDYSRYAKWPVFYRDVLLISGLVFDIIFTIEFIVRTTINSKQNQFVDYFWYRRGWVDFLSSVPLLLLNSGPSFYILMTGDVQEMAAGIGVLNVLKVIKAIRVTRILRLVRVVKIFGKIHNTDSPMAQHHTATVTTTAVFSIIFTLIIFSAVFPSINDSGIKQKTDNYVGLLQSIDKITEDKGQKLLSISKSFFEKDSNVIFLEYEGSSIIDLDSENFKKYYSHEDFRIIEASGFKMFVSVLDENASIALIHIQSFAAIIVLVLAFALLYTKHFAQNVTDIIHILNRGFRKKDYNLQIKINEHYKDHEVFRLAKFYNDAYLPAKMKKNQDKAQGGKGLSMKDLMNFKN